MDVNKLLGLRPKTESVADIEAALTAALAARAAAEEAEAALLAKRGDVLMTAPPEDVTEAEGALVRIRLERDQVGTMIPLLEARLAAARRKPFTDETRQMVEEAEAADRAFGEFLERDYPELAQRLVEGLALERKAEDLREALRGRVPEMTPAERAAFRFPERPVVWPSHLHPVGSLVRLPDVQQPTGYEWPLWPVRA